eukprot:213731-Amphidinium_carterae.1
MNRGGMVIISARTVTPSGALLRCMLQSKIPLRRGGMTLVLNSVALSAYMRDLLQQHGMSRTHTPLHLRSSGSLVIATCSLIVAGRMRSTMSALSLLSRGQLAC